MEFAPQAISVQISGIRVLSVEYCVLTRWLHCRVDGATLRVASTLCRHDHRATFNAFKADDVINDVCLHIHIRQI
jgi:hypothetical protein